MSTLPSAARVRLRSIPAAAGLSWIRRGLRLFWRRPLGFIGLWLFFTLCLMPIMLLAVALGSPLALLAMAALPPLVSVGFMQAASDVLDDVKLRPSVFRAPFAGAPQAAHGMLAIMLIYVAAAALLAFAADAMDGGETRRWLQAVMTPPPEGQAPVIPPISDASLSAIRFMMLGLTLVSIPLWHAPALVHWGRQGIAQALFSSVVALWRTKGAFLAFVLGWLAVSVAYDGLLQLMAAAFDLEAVSLAALGGQMILSIGYFLSMWFGFLDTFEIASPVAPRTVMAERDPSAS